MKGLLIRINLVPRAMPVRGLGLALALGKRNEIRNFIGCREINNLGARKKSYADRFRFPRANANPNPRTGIALGTRLH